MPPFLLHLPASQHPITRVLADGTVTPSALSHPLCAVHVAMRDNQTSPFIPHIGTANHSTRNPSTVILIESVSVQGRNAATILGKNGLAQEHTKTLQISYMNLHRNKECTRLPVSCRPSREARHLVHVPQTRPSLQLNGSESLISLYRWRFHRVIIGDHHGALEPAMQKSSLSFGPDMTHHSYGRSPWISNVLGAQGNTSSYRIFAIKKDLSNHPAVLTADRYIPWPIKKGWRSDPLQTQSRQMFCSTDDMTTTPANTNTNTNSSGEGNGIWRVLYKTSARAGLPIHQLL